ncbi:uncharacterized protein LOC129869792 [Solanum dulcamara]|uniref:uncharacterized protein LOC129869792 n=1 Tax=Solanum dulcamara TaxID=45834 RepID=UPI002486AD23|nr:uncharacterized protein LOC129869792 [Solanum dulcamara]
MSQRDLNSIQRHWIELLVDYDISILYHSGKANIVVDALSWKAGNMDSLAYLPILERPLALDIHSLDNRMVRLDIIYSGPILAFVGARSSTLDQIRGRQFEDEALFLESFSERVPWVDLSTAFHPQTDDQSEHTIQILEDMLRSWILEFDGQWDQFLSLAKFATTTATTLAFIYPYLRLLRPYMVGIVALLSDGLSPQSLDHTVGDRVFLRVSPLKGVKIFARRGKLSPRYIVPFEILRKVGEVSYELALPPDFWAIYLVFHVSMLRWYIPDESHILQYDSVKLDDRLIFVKERVAILARDVRQLRSRSIHVVKMKVLSIVDVVMTFQCGSIQRPSKKEKFQKSDLEHACLAYRSEHQLPPLIDRAYCSQIRRPG